MPGSPLKRCVQVVSRAHQPREWCRLHRWDVLFPQSSVLSREIICARGLEADTSDESYETQEDRRPARGAFRQRQVGFMLWLEVKCSWFVTFFSQRWDLEYSQQSSKEQFHGEFTNGFWSLSKFGHSEQNVNQLDELEMTVFLLDTRLAPQLHFSFEGLPLYVWNHTVYSW